MQTLQADTSVSGYIAQTTVVMQLCSWSTASPSFFLFAGLPQSRQNLSDRSARLWRRYSCAWPEQQVTAPRRLRSSGICSRQRMQNVSKVNLTPGGFCSAQSMRPIPCGQAATARDRPL